MVTDIQTMCTSLPLHPLCVTFADALRSAGTNTIRLHSLCLGHLDECALNAAAEALHASGVPTGLTVNDSLTIQRARPSTLSPSDILLLAENAVAARLGYKLSFSFFP